MNAVIHETYVGSHITIYVYGQNCFMHAAMHETYVGSHITIYVLVYASMHETYVSSYVSTCAKVCIMITVHEKCVRLCNPHMFHVC